jgi:hypothetical protein
MSTRRNLLAFTAGAVAVLPLAAKAAETHPDRELLSACASFNAIEAEVQRINGKKGAEYDDDEMDIAIAAWYDALEVAHRVSARTPAGLKAKGTIAHLMFAHALEEDQAPPEPGGVLRSLFCTR